MKRSTGPNLNTPFNRPRRRHRILVRGLKALVVVTLVLVGVAIWAARALPRIAAAQISRLTNTRVQMGPFDFHHDASVSIDGLVLRPERTSASEDDAILRAGNIHAYFSLRSLLALAPRLTEIHIDDFILNAQFDMDTGRWNVGDLRIRKPPGKRGRLLPTVILEQGTLRYSKASGGKSEVVMSVPVEADFGWVEEPRRGYRFGIKTARLSSGYGQSHLDGFWQPGRLTLAGGLSSTDIPSLERAWAADVIAAELTYDSNDNYTLDLHIKNAYNKQSPEADAFRSLMPMASGQSGLLAAPQWFFTRYRPSGIVGQIELKARGNLKRLAQSEVIGTLTCTDVSVCDRKFPYAIDHLAGELSFTQSSVVLNQLTGKHGDVDLMIDGWTKGSGQNRQYQYRVTSDNMILDTGLYAALGPGHKRMWDAFKPRGVVGVDYRLGRTATMQKHEYASVTLQHVAATYEKFPYPLEELTGELYFDDESIIARDLVSQAGGRSIKVDGKITHRDAGNPIYYISVDGNDIPLDAVLGKALPEHYRKLYEQFDASGTAAVRAKVFTTGDANDAGSISFVADVSARMASLKSQKLPVVLSDAVAELSFTPESITVKKLTGRYGDSPVSLSGGGLLSGGSLPQVQLKAQAENVPLNGEMINLLPESVREHVAAFDPQGKVNLAIDVRRRANRESPEYTIGVECLGNSVKHQQFAYPLRDIRGNLTIGSGKVVLDGIEAVPGAGFAGGLPPTIRLDGHLDLTGSGADPGSFTIAAHNIPLMQQLGDALPGELGRTYRDASPQGSFDLDLDIPTISKAAADDKRLDFKGKISLNAHDLHIAGPAAELRGDVNVEGTYGTRAGLCDARIDLDAKRLTIRGKSITDLRGAIVFDPNARTWSAPGFVGDCCEGRVVGDLELYVEDESAWRYALRAAFYHVSLQQFLAAGKTAGVAESDYGSGIMDASLSLGARVGDDSSRLGSCRVDVVDMRVGRVSPLANFLSVLQLNEPTDYTFDRMLIESYLKRDTLMIQKLDMSGKNVAFVGSGTMNTSSNQVNLTLTARGRRVATAKPGVLESLAEGLGGAVVRMEVTGKADNPSVTTKTLPLIEDSLRILGTPK
jgi:hypothetical protein